ncbi:hypothetical protein GCM10023219_02730 [Stakelama sediminis]|uniref:Tetratricopeptide (TPR) repeat protein n=1 Tax=Stakelama sediminis TaxID=463200 RepID=A0A840YZY3_9SPHN|nr:tetratricopeptide repeat protein [Stakelama sediminis]MBB5719097.1 tetratricopeptide (TPR) repeat protein [Stakelama sediminis]
MTFSPERLRWRRIGLAGGILMLIAAVVLVVTVVLPARQTSAHAHQALARSLAFLKAGNASAARSQAFTAVQEKPDWGLAHAVLARAYLELGQGDAAQGELDRAQEQGFDMNRVHQLYAQALLLESDLDGAQKELAKAGPRFRSYTLRVRTQLLIAQGDFANAGKAAQRAVTLQPDSAQAWTDLGEYRVAAGDLAGAITASVRAVQLAPGNTNALLLRAHMVRDQYGPMASLPWFEAALKRDPWRYSTLIEYAATLGDLGRYRPMLAAVRKAMLAEPDDPRGYYLQAVLAARAGNYDLARGILAHVGDAMGDVPGMMLLQGSLDLQASNPQQAVTELQQLVGVQPMNLVARRLLAQAYIESGSPQDALDILKPMATRADADPYTLRLTARAFEQRGDRIMAAKFLDRASYPSGGGATPFSPDDGLATLDLAVDDSPNQAQAILPYVRGLLTDGRTEQALAQAQEAVQANPGAPAVQMLLGDVLVTQHRYDDAVQAYRRAATIRFDEPIMLRLVNTLDAGGDRQGAARVLALFLSQNPENVTALRIAAQWQLASGDDAAAVNTLEGLRKRLGNRDATLLAQLATACAALGENARATRYGAQAYALAPADPAVVDAYGWALHGAGKDTLALQLLRKAVAIAPDHAGLRWHLAQADAAAGNKAAAIANIRAALAQRGFADRDDAEALLKQLS